jgi:hypothetical protein
MAIEIVDFPIENGDFPLFCKRLPEGMYIYIYFLGGGPVSQIQDDVSGCTLQTIHVRWDFPIINRYGKIMKDIQWVNTIQNL